MSFYMPIPYALDRTFYPKQQGQQQHSRATSFTLATDIPNPLPQNTIRKARATVFGRDPAAQLNISRIPHHSPNKKHLPVSKRYKVLSDQLGEGIGGRVRLIKRLSDNKLFALKEFKQKDRSETQRDYKKKVGAEYTIGSTLKHQNIIKTIEINHESNKIYQILEYGDYDLYALVRSERMSLEEKYCCFKQLCNGVHYLHHTGLAHRDLKLDNCVVNKYGIVKIIDFGAAVVFNYPYSENTIQATGVVGSEPYLAPEEKMNPSYDPRCVDIWALGIILFTMLTNHFAWDSPTADDEFFKSFITRKGKETLFEALKRSSETTINGPLANPKYTDVSSSEEEESINEPEQKETENYQPTMTSAGSVLIYDQYCTEGGNDVAFDESSIDSEPNYEYGSNSCNPNTSLGSLTSANSLQINNSNNDTTATPGSKHHISYWTRYSPPTRAEERLLVSLPEETHFVFRGMLALAPCDRLSIDEILHDDWMRMVQICTEFHDKERHEHKIISAKNHKHIQLDKSEAHIANLIDTSR